MVKHNCQGETANSEHSLKGGNRPWRAKISAENFKVNRESLNRQNLQMTLKPMPTSGLFKDDTSFIVITSEARGQLYVPNEETFPIPLKYIDATRSTHSYWSGRVARETNWRLLECWFEQTFVWFVERIYKVHSVEREASQRIFVIWEEDWQTFNRLADQIMYGQKCGRKLVKPLRIEKNNSGQKTSQNSTMLEDWGKFT